MCIDKGKATGMGTGTGTACARVQQHLRAAVRVDVLVPLVKGDKTGLASAVIEARKHLGSVPDLGADLDGRVPGLYGSGDGLQQAE